jgi:hypothetical protein
MLTSNMRSQSASLISTTVPLRITPALLTRMSTPPKARAASENSASTSVARLTSQGIGTAIPPPETTLLCGHSGSVRIAVSDHDGTTFIGKGQDTGPADTLCAARNHDCLVFKPGQ